MAKIIAWTDVESCGTRPEVDSLLEVAVVFTDFLGEPVADPYTSLVTVKNLNRVIHETDEIVRTMHEHSGLWKDLWTKETKSEECIDAELQERIDRLGSGTSLVFGGNSPILDRRFAELYLPGFYRKISHRTVDVTTLSMVFQESKAAQMYFKRGEHRALPDVWDSIEEYRHYLSWLASR